MPDAAHHAGPPPAANEKSKEMRGAQYANLPFGETLFEPCQRVQGSDPTGGQLQEDNRQEERRKR